MADFAQRFQLSHRPDQLARALLQFLQQPHVLDGDNRLIGKGRHQIDLSCGKRSRIGSEDDNDTDRNTLSKQRDAEYRSEIYELRDIMIFRISSKIGNVNHSAFQHGSSCDRLLSDTRWVSLNEVMQLRRMAVRSRERQHLAVHSVNGPMLGIAKSGCVLNQRIQHRLQIERRAANDFQNFAGRRLLL